MTGSPLIFRATKRGLLDSTFSLATGKIVGHLVTTAPTDALITQLSQLTLATGGNYARVVLLNTGDARTFTNTSTGSFWTFASPAWNALTSDGTAIVGMAVVKEAGASQAGTDPPICFNPLSSNYTPNGANFTIILPNTGAMLLD